MKEKKDILRDTRETITVFAILLILAVAKKIFGHNNDGMFLHVALIALPILILVSSYSGTFCSFFAKWWRKLVMVIGFINSRIILSIVYYLILTPIALLYRATGKDVLQLKKKADTNSYFKKRNHVYQPDDLEKAW